MYSDKKQVMLKSVKKQDSHTCNRNRTVSTRSNLRAFFKNDIACLKELILRKKRCVRLCAVHSAMTRISFM